MSEDISSAEGRVTGDPPNEMAPLVIGPFRKGPTWTPESTPQVIADQRRHLANFQSLAAQGVPMLSGPIPGGDPYRGLILLDFASLEEAAEVMAANAHLTSGRFQLDLFPLLVDAKALDRPLKIPPGGDIG